MRMRARLVSTFGNNSLVRCTLRALLLSVHLLKSRIVSNVPVW
jgi:hypothetical protein